jgi:transcription-repair coupling factor (superfamily II helicase)
VGRSKTRAYALFSVPANKSLTVQAERRLKVLQTLDTLGAGFQLASHDLDIRGAGNLLGEEQSGHIKEVGYELYQQMLERRWPSSRRASRSQTEDQWSPSIAVGRRMMIPEGYIADLQLRLGSIAACRPGDRREIDALPGGADRPVRTCALGGGPASQDHGHQVLCRRANVGEGGRRPQGHHHLVQRQLLRQPTGSIGYVTEQASSPRSVPT